MESKEVLQDRLVEINDQAQALTEKDPFTDEDQFALDALFQQFERVEQRLKVIENSEQLGTSRRLSPSTATENPHLPLGRIQAGEIIPNARDEQTKRGLLMAAIIRQDHGEVRRLSTAIAGARLDPSQIFAANPNIDQAGVGAEVQLPVPVINELTAKMLDEGLLPRLRQYSSPADSLKVAGGKGYDSGTVDGAVSGMVGRIVADSSPAAYAALTSDRYETEEVTFTLRRHISFGQWGWALFATSPQAAWMDFVDSATRAVRHLIEYNVINDATHGVIASAATIDVAKVSGQAADTIVVSNVETMRSRIYDPKSAIWLCNHDAFLQVSGLHKAGTNSDEFIFTPGNGSDVPDTLYGREILFSDLTPTVGDNGDLLLIEPMQIGLCWHASAPISVQASDQHDFNRDLISLKVRAYCGYRPLWSSAYTPRTSTTTRSPYVAIAERA